MGPRAVVNYPLAIGSIVLVAGAAFAQTREDAKNYPSRPIRWQQPGVVVRELLHRLRVTVPVLANVFAVVEA